MPCRDDYPCDQCHQYPCVCDDPHYQKWGHFDFEGALCDVLSMLETSPGGQVQLTRVDKKVLEWWSDHEEREKDRIKAEALAKLSPRERRALGL